ncbi:protein of unknown function [Cardinium endosymbiont cEper1 of Encarsia pergandiella]|nr:protein of unknown function [Cardinium endosymbiont cEper1 of Encarsia pergandiella]
MQPDNFFALPWIAFVIFFLVSSQTKMPNTAPNTTPNDRQYTFLNITYFKFKAFKTLNKTKTHIKFTHFKLIKL